MSASAATEADFLACREVERRHGSSYFAATRLFPRDLRQATWALYAFFRLPDEIVDAPEDSAEVCGLPLPPGTTPEERLATWRSWWHEALRTGASTHPVLRATAATFARYAIPPELAEAFLDAMAQDAWKSRYATYDELRQYMYGSAAAVGLMMTHAIGFSSPDALVRATALGEAMQLTNFVRDVGEDARERGRVYLPLEDLARFGAREEDVLAQRMTPAFVALLRFEIARARQLYADAEPGIALLDRRGRFAVRAASRLYAGILDEVEKNGHDVLTQRARTSGARKLRLVIGTL
jgi:phytoene synthase